MSRPQKTLRTQTNQFADSLDISQSQQTVLRPMNNIQLRTQCHGSDRQSSESTHCTQPPEPPQVSTPALVSASNSALSETLVAKHLEVDWSVERCPAVLHLGGCPAIYVLCRRPWGTLICDSKADMFCYCKKQRDSAYQLNVLGHSKWSHASRRYRSRG